MNFWLLSHALKTKAMAKLQISNVLWIVEYVLNLFHRPPGTTETYVFTHTNFRNKKDVKKRNFPLLLLLFPTPHANCSRTFFFIAQGSPSSLPKSLCSRMIYFIAQGSTSLTWEGFGRNSALVNEGRMN
jgi:hypothetical protein